MGATSSASASWIKGVGGSPGGRGGDLRGVHPGRPGKGGLAAA